MHDTGGCPTIIWLSALQVELAPLLALLRPPEATQVAELVCWRGYLRNHELVASVCGVGGEASRKALASLLAVLPDARVLLVGTAGALDPCLSIGNVIVANRAIAWPEGDDGPPSQQRVLGARADLPALSEMPLGKPGQTIRVVPGRVISWDALVCEPALKAQLREVYSADCVDMETGHAAQFCAARGVPFLAVRGIADYADVGVEENRLKPQDLAIAVWHATIVAVQALDWLSEAEAHTVQYTNHNANAEDMSTLNEVGEQVI